MTALINSWKQGLCGH